MCERRLQGQAQACPATWPDDLERWCGSCRHQYNVWLDAQADEARGEELVGASTHRPEDRPEDRPEPLRPVLTMAADLDSITDDSLWQSAWKAPRPDRPPGPPPTN